MKKRTWIFIVLLLAAAVWMLFPRQTYEWRKPQAQNDQESKVVLRFESPWDTKSLKGSILNRQIQRFMEENPGIEVVNESMNDENFLEKITVDFVSGNEPDVFAMWPGYNSDIFIQLKKTADLSALLDENPQWQSSFDKSVWRYVTREDDKIYGIPLELTYQCLFVNTELFAAYHIPIPTNWEELKYAVVKFRENGVIPIEYGMQDKNAYLFENLVAALGGSTGVTDPVVNGQINEYYRRAVEYMQELYRLGAFPDDIFDLSEKSRDLFLEKKAAMCVQTSDFIGELNQRETTFYGRTQESGEQQLSVDMLTFPNMADGNADQTAIIYGMGSGTFSISQNAWDDPEKKDAAARLLMYLTSDDSAKEFAESAGMLVSKKGAALRQSYYGALLKKGLSLIDETREPIAPIENTVERRTWQEILVHRLPAIISGSGSEETLWDEILKRQRSLSEAEEKR